MFNINIFLLFGFILYANCNGYYFKERATGELRKACSSRGFAVQPKGRIKTGRRLLYLRKLMVNETALQTLPIDAYIVTSGDEHQSEFVSEHDRRREYISGFSGSKGDAIITLNKSALWTDGRFHLQADDQIDCNWLLMREGYEDVPTKADWLKNELPNGGRVGADPKLISEHLWQEIRSELRNSKLELVEIDTNLIDLIWTEKRPSQRNKDVFIWTNEYAGKSYKEKIAETRKKINETGADAMIVTSLDEVAWLLNIRGRDIPYNPFVRSYLIIDINDVVFYVNKTQLEKNKITKFFHAEYGISDSSISVEDYGKIWRDIPTKCQLWKKVLIPSAYSYSLGVSHAIYTKVPEEKRLLHESPIIDLKAKKNEVEIEGMEKAHIRDAAALCEFFAYFETRFSSGDEFTELDVVNILNEFRFEQNDSLGNSFRTIAAFGSNGAHPNYEPTPVTNARIFDNSTLVLESGGQYKFGTTDVTRTLHMGTPTLEQKEAYTRVLMGNIQMSLLTFPSKMRANIADLMARAPMWEIGLDYLHETSHGIGTFLGVRESPVSIHYNGPNFDQYLVPGYFISNEPGIYRESQFGVRLENIMKVIEKYWLKRSPEISFLGFQDVTLVPYEPRLISLPLLSHQHRQWLNEYNAKIRLLVGEELKIQNKMDGFYWMMEKTKEIPLAGNIPKPYCIILVCEFLLVILLFY